MGNIYDFTVLTASGKPQPLSDYQGKVLLIVNTASACGYTPQYKELQLLHEAWHNQGLQILAFPCNQFGQQEQGTNAEIQQFCQLNYGVTFPVLAKIEVNGENAHPLYQYLHALGGELGADIHWNFTKFLVDQSGNVVKRFEPQVTPKEIEPEISALLKAG